VVAPGRVGQGRAVPRPAGTRAKPRVAGAATPRTRRPAPARVVQARVAVRVTRVMPTAVRAPTPVVMVAMGRPVPVVRATVARAARQIPETRPQLTATALLATVVTAPVEVVAQQPPRLALRPVGLPPAVLEMVAMARVAIARAAMAVTRPRLQQQRLQVAVTGPVVPGPVVAETLPRPLVLALCPLSARAATARLATVQT